MVRPGESVRITVQTTNLEFQPGICTVNLEINDEIVAVVEQPVSALETETLTFFEVREDPGEYTVRIGDLTGTFRVVPEELPAECLSFADLVIDPPEVAPEELVTISAMAQNSCDFSGSVDVVLRINTEVEGQLQESLPALGSVEVVFEYTAPSEEETLLVEVGDLLGLVDPVTGELVVSVPLVSIDCTFSNLEIEPQEAAPGEMVSIRVRATNIEDLAGICRVILLVDGLEVATGDVEIGPLTTIIVSLSILAPEAPGDHAVRIGELEGSLYVIPEDAHLVRGRVILEGRATHAGVIVMFSGQDPVTTDADGSYQIGLLPGIYEVTAQKEGFLAAAKAVEVNSDITISTVVLLAGDANADGRVDVSDLALAGRNQGSDHTPWSD